MVRILFKEHKKARTSLVEDPGLNEDFNQSIEGFINHILD